MDTKPNVEVLTREECLELLATRPVGRVGVMTELHPVIFPVNYVLDGDAIVFRTGGGPALEHAADQPVAFEVDDIDVENKSERARLGQGERDRQWQHARLSVARV